MFKWAHEELNLGLHPYQANRVNTPNTPTRLIFYRLKPTLQALLFNCIITREITVFLEWVGAQKRNYAFALLGRLCAVRMAATRQTTAVAALSRPPRGQPDSNHLFGNGV